MRRAWLGAWGAACLVAAVACGGCQNGGGNSAAEEGVVLLRYNPGSESTEQREKGFLETLAKEFPTIKVISSDQYALTTPEQALDKATDVLNRFEGRVTGIFAVCEPNANGVLTALQNAKLAGKVKFVAFDPSPSLIRGMSEGSVHGIVLQDPVTMGYKAVQTILAHLDGKSVKPIVSTGEYVATPENMKEEKSKKLLEPEQFDESVPTIEKPKYRIAVIPKGTTHEFWKSVHAGAERAAREAGNARVIWKGPLLENDRDGQINVVQDFITDKVDGIVLAPLDSQALIGPVKEAKKHNIPTVIFDSGLGDESAIVSYVATNNYEGGALAARRLAEVLGVKPKSP